MIDLLMQKYQARMEPKDMRKVMVEMLKKKAIEAAAKNREYQAAVQFTNSKGR